MKKIILSIIILSNFSFVFSQTNTNWGLPFSTEKKAFYIEEVVQLNGISKDELYKRANDWITDYFTAGQKKIYERDPNQNFIKLRHRITVYRMVKKEKVNEGILEFHIDLNFKDGKYKYSFYDFKTFAGPSSQPIEKWMDPNDTGKEEAIAKYTNINNLMLEIIGNLKKYMETGKKQANTDW